MRMVAQEDDFGCGVACVAFVLEIKYKDALYLFENGEERAKNNPNFYCREICEILGEKYHYRYIKLRLKNRIYRDGTIVFIKRNNKYIFGHYLVRCYGKWMDPWINLANKPIKAGFRIRLPGKPIYMIQKKEKSPRRGFFCHVS